MKPKKPSGIAAEVVALRMVGILLSAITAIISAICALGVVIFDYGKPSLGFSIPVMVFAAAGVILQLIAFAICRLFPDANDHIPTTFYDLGDGHYLLHSTVTVEIIAKDRVDNSDDGRLVFNYHGMVYKGQLGTPSAHVKDCHFVKLYHQIKPNTTLCVFGAGQAYLARCNDGMAGRRTEGDVTHMVTLIGDTLYQGVLVDDLQVKGACIYSLAGQGKYPSVTKDTADVYSRILIAFDGENYYPERQQLIVSFRRLSDQNVLVQRVSHHCSLLPVLFCRESELVHQDDGLVKLNRGYHTYIGRFVETA